MPTYSYQCTNCGDRFDAVQSFSDDALTTCAKCAGKLRKLFGSVGVVFKGSGFYRTDSRAANGSSLASNPKPDGAGAAEKSAGSSEKSGSATKSNGSEKSGSGSSKPSKSSTPAAAG